MKNQFKYLCSCVAFTLWLPLAGATSLADTISTAEAEVEKTVSSISHLQSIRDEVIQPFHDHVNAQLGRAWNAIDSAQTVKTADLLSALEAARESADKIAELPEITIQAQHNKVPCYTAQLVKNSEKEDNVDLTQSSKAPQTETGPIIPVAPGPLLKEAFAEEFDSALFNGFANGQKGMEALQAFLILSLQTNKEDAFKVMGAGGAIQKIPLADNFIQSHDWLKESPLVINDNGAHSFLNFTNGFALGGPRGLPAPQGGCALLSDDASSFVHSARIKEQGFQTTKGLLMSHLLSTFQEKGSLKETETKSGHTIKYADLEKAIASETELYQNMIKDDAKNFDPVLYPSAMKPGDIVIFKKHTGSDSGAGIKAFLAGPSSVRIFLGYTQINAGEDKEREAAIFLSANRDLEGYGMEGKGIAELIDMGKLAQDGKQVYILRKKDTAQSSEA